MRVLENWDVASLYPTLVVLYGYSSRNQKDAKAYEDLRNMRIKAKHGELSDEFLKPMNLTNNDLKGGLKLPLNAYTGCLRASFNALYDNLQGFSICTTGQLFILQLIHDLQQVPTLEMVSANTDAVMYTIEEEYKEQARKVLDKWQELTGLELEEDKIVKIVMRDVNNYAEIVQTGDNDYEVHYKGGELTRGEHKFTWNKEKKMFEYSFKDSLKSNSLSIVSEGILKFLLFDTPIENTINNCNDIFRFQMISHLGSTYEKCVQESPNGDIEIQKNNRIYAGNVSRGTIIKIKPDGRRDSLANCPPNPIVDNANECTIEDINKEWYIEFAQEKANDFLGIKRLEEYKKEELLELAGKMSLEIDKKTKKEELIKIIKNHKKSLTTKLDYDILNKKGDEIVATKAELEEKLTKAIEQNEKLVEKLKERNDNMVTMNNNEPTVYYDDTKAYVSLNKKINELRKYIRSLEFCYDSELPSNLGGKEYYSVGQFYDAVQDGCVKVGLDFSFETVEIISFDKELIKPAGRTPIHVATVKTRATLTDIETNAEKTYITIGQGSDSMDKAVSCAETMAFRQWFTKNFSPKGASDEEDVINDEPKSEQPKVPVYVPETKKEEIKKEVVKQVQQESSDDEDIAAITNNIMAIREKIGDQEYGAKTLEKVMSGTLSSADLMEIDMKIKNKMEKVGL